MLKSKTAGPRRLLKGARRGLAVLLLLWTLGIAFAGTLPQAEPGDLLPFWNRAVYADAKGDKMKATIEEAKKRLAQTKESIQQLRTQSLDIKGKLQGLELENEKLKAQKEEIKQQLDEAETTLLKRQQEEVDATDALLAQQATYEKRLQSMFYFKQKSSLEILLESRGLEGFFTNLRMLTAIAEADAKLIARLQAAEEVAQNASQLAVETKEAFDQFLQEKVEEIARLEEGIEATKEEARKLNYLLANRSLEIKDIEKDIAQKEAAYRAYLAALERYKDVIGKLNPAGSNAVWPLPASQQIYSPYGYRNMGVDRGNGYLHTGTDFAGPNVAGTPVVAAWEGVVMTVHQPYPGQMYAPDANYVQIGHGGGLGTGYWHLSKVIVSPGQHVQKGQIIGYCGSTGMSTGPHLHFEVYDENNPKRAIRNTVDPMLYLGG